MSGYFHCNLFQLLKHEWKRDKTIITCMCNGGDDGNWDFTKDKDYKIYLSTGRPRIYNDCKSQITSSTLAFNSESDLPMFRVKEMDVKRKTVIRKKKTFNPVEWIDSEVLLKEDNVKRVVNRLNGIKLMEENLVELRQASSESKSLQIDLVDVLQNNESVKGLELGKNAILKSLNIEDDRLHLKVSVGEVTKEDNGAVLKALQNMVTGKDEK